MSKDGWLVTVDDVWEDVKAMFAFPGEFKRVSASMSLKDRFNAIRHNYRRHQAMVDAGLSEWFKGDPYEIADWPALFTPIEYALWFDIRGRGLDLWPQLPVGRFFVDFGNPVAKLAVECDGAQWHKDKAKDNARDEELRDMGWTVIRIPGYLCKAEILNQTQAEEEKGIDPEDYESWRDQNTPYLAMRMAKDILDEAKQESLWEKKKRRAARA